MASGPPGSNQLGYVPYGGGAPGAGAAAGLGVTTPITNPKDCVPGFCTANCPQWCYFFPPPPPFDFPDDGGDSSSGPTFSPLVIAIIGILGSAFLLIAYYTIISKYCARLESLRHGGRRRRRHDHTTPLTDDGDGVDGAHHMRHLQGPDGWQNAALVSEGLDEAVIKSITVCKYKKGDGFVEGTDCPVCLTEFHEDESLRLLPKCGHAFHVSCIDTWLKSHSNCPLCRANIAPIPLPMSPPAPVRLPQPAPPQNHQQQGQTHQPHPDPLSRASSNRVNYSVSMEDLLLDRGGSGRREQSVPAPGTAAAAASVKDNSYTASTTIRGFQRGLGSETRGGVDAAAMYEFRDDGAHAHPSRRRDHHISIGQVMETEDGGRGAADAASASSGRRVFVQHSKYGPSKVLHCVMNGFGGGNNNNRHNDNTGSYTHPV